MVNLILILDIRAKRVADTKIKTDINLGHKGQAGGRHQNKPTKKGDTQLWVVFLFGGANDTEVEVQDSKSKGV